MPCNYFTLNAFKMEYTFRNKALSDKASSAYINISTGRVILDTRKKGFQYLDIASLYGSTGGPFICSPPETMAEFRAENAGVILLHTKASEEETQRIIGKPILPVKATIHSSLSPQFNNMCLTLPPPERVVVLSPIGPSVVMAAKVPTLPFNALVNAPVPAAIAKPRESSAMKFIHKIEHIFDAKPRQLMLPSEDPVCNYDSAGVGVFTPKNDNIDDIPEDAIDGLCHFHLSGLSGKGRIVRVIDGDTVEMMIYVPLVGLIHKQGQGRGHRKLQAAALTRHSNVGFFSLFSCRLLGIDFAEHNTEQGAMGTKIMSEVYKSLNNRVYYRTGKFDKYGRLLVNLYADAEYKKSLNDMFLGVTFDGIGHVVEPYDGGCKSVYMKKLPVAPSRGKGSCEEDEEDEETVDYHADKELLLDSRGGVVGMYGRD